MPMVIDGLDDTVAKDYAGFPDRLYVVGKDGRVAFKGGPGPFGFRPDEMERSLKKILAKRGCGGLGGSISTSPAQGIVDPYPALSSLSGFR